MLNHVPFYVSVDIETTGLDPYEHQIIEFAAVAWTNDGPVWQLPYFHRIIQPEGNIVGSPYALSLNKAILDQLHEGNGVHMGYALLDFTNWLTSLGVTTENKVNIVGQNFASFDLQFLNQWVAWPEELIHHRYFDLSTICAIPTGIPSASSLGDVEGLEGNEHEALFDALRALHHVREWILDNGK